MARILVNLPDTQIEELAAIAEAEHRSRAAVIRDAVKTYISQRKLAHGADVFGLWKDSKIDGLAYQLERRSEW
ncbi:ribbon-helix-helix protein, CopG family [Cupriavidus oxalaticus]|uniref:Ribbon-helix-helix protein, CopG family n=1 Tax=Cupriavidus oxalaticus TaxID=96344 RepID=A0A5P3VVB0_9BURK|nr:ribbon-helix-helix protein, CopG family [Cupriavidus oxalaticus]QEZ48699.1 ribbon-helix-helix protein, CopG family [Cupriavidus oxalaticus]